MSYWANVKMLAGLHAFLEALEENPRPAPWLMALRLHLQSQKC